jgi:hypothetical protein
VAYAVCARLSFGAPALVQASAAVVAAPAGWLDSRGVPSVRSQYFLLGGHRPSVSPGGLIEGCAPGAGLARRRGMGDCYPTVTVTLVYRYQTATTRGYCVTYLNRIRV